MALIVEAVGRSGVTERVTVEGGRAAVNAQPGLAYRILDAAGQPVNASATVRRVGDHLIIEGLPEEASIQLTDFFFVCTPNDPCSLDLEGLGGARGETINQVSEPVAALADGSFVLHAPASMATPTAPESEFSAKPALAGLALLGLAGGGGGGGGGSSGPAPGTPVVTSLPLTNDSTPTISGTATPGASITLTIDVPGSGPVTFVTTADEAGNWTIDTGAAPNRGTMPPEGLPEGEITALLIAQNTGGNSPDPVQFRINVDTTPPAAIAELTAVTDDAEGITGALADGALTNDPTPTLSGTLSQALEAGDVVRILRDGVPIGTALVNGTQWEYEDSGLTDGATHVYSVRVEDAAGNASAATPDFTISTDFTRPAQPTINTIAGDNFVNEAEARVSNPSPITVSGTADPGAVVRIVWGVEVEDVVAAANGIWTFDFDGQQIPDGNYTVTATVHDAAGNASEPASLGVQVLTGKPSAPSFNPVEGDNLVNAEEALDGVTLTGGTTPNTTVAVTIDGAVYAATVTGNTWSLILPAGTLPDGTYTASAVATDAAGNVSVAGNTDDPFIVDGTPPAQTVAITGAEDNVAAGIGIIADGGLTNDQTPTIQGTLSAGLAAGEAVHVYRAGTLLGAATVSGTNWSYGDSLATDGTHSYTAQVVDAAGNLGPMSAGFSLVLDRTPPATPSIDAVSTDNRINAAEAGAGVTITGTGAEAGGSVSVTWGGGAAKPAVVAGDGTWSVTFLAAEIPADGITTVTATGYDQAGNASAPAATQSVTIDRVAPGVAITNDAGGATNGPVTFTFTFTEAVQGFTAGDITVVNGIKGTLVAVSATTYTMEVTPVDTGPMTVNVVAGVANDTAGNGNTAGTGATTVTVDLTPPTPAITDNVAGTANGPVTFTFNFGEAVNDFTPADVTVSGGTAAATFASGSDGSSIYTLVVTPPADQTGTISVSVTHGAATDLAGNPSNAAGPVTQAFDTVAPPTVTIGDQTGDAVTNDVVTFTFEFSEPLGGTDPFDISDIVVTGGTPGALAQVDELNYTLPVTPTANVNNGTISVSVAAERFTDAQNNANIAGDSHTQNYDTLPPTPTITDNVGGTADGPVTFTFNFGEAVTGFTPADVTVSNGIAAATFASGSDGFSVYTLVVNPAPGDAGTITVDVAAGVATDGAGNSSLEATQASQAYDTRTISITELLDDVGVPTPTPIPSGGTGDDATPTITVTLFGPPGSDTITLFRNGSDTGLPGAQSGNTWEFEDNLVADASYTYQAVVMSGGSPILQSDPWVYNLFTSPP